MKRGYHRKRHDDAGFQMAPMIDMVFLLLVFFMCVSTISNADKLIPIRLAQSQTASVKKIPWSPLVISIDHKKNLYLNNQRIRQQKLHTTLKELSQEHSHLSVKIRASRESPYQIMKPVIEMIKHCGIQDYQLAVYEK